MNKNAGGVGLYKLSRLVLCVRAANKARFRATDAMVIIIFFFMVGGWTRFIQRSLCRCGIKGRGCHRLGESLGSIDDHRLLQGCPQAVRLDIDAGDIAKAADRRQIDDERAGDDDV